MLKQYNTRQRSTMSISSDDDKTNGSQASSKDCATAPKLHDRRLGLCNHDTYVSCPQIRSTMVHGRSDICTTANNLGMWSCYQAWPRSLTRNLLPGNQFLMLGINTLYSRSVEVTHVIYSAATHFDQLHLLGARSSSCYDLLLCHTSTLTPHLHISQNQITRKVRKIV
jgi:hypothetical protein